MTLDISIMHFPHNRDRGSEIHFLDAMHFQQAEICVLYNFCTKDFWPLAGR